MAGSEGYGMERIIPARQFELRRGLVRTGSEQKG